MSYTAFEFIRALNLLFFPHAKELVTFSGKAQIADILGLASHEVSTKLLSSAAVAGKQPWMTCKQMGMAGSNTPLLTTLWRQVEETVDLFFLTITKVY